jgi:hypothetical protein
MVIRFCNISKSIIGNGDIVDQYTTELPFRIEEISVRMELPRFGIVAEDGAVAAVCATLFELAEAARQIEQPVGAEPCGQSPAMKRLAEVFHFGPLRIEPEQFTAAAANINHSVRPESHVIVTLSDHLATVGPGTVVELVLVRVVPEQFRAPIVTGMVAVI